MKKFVVLLICVFLVGIGIGYAQDAGGPDKRDDMKVYSQLNLTADQKDQVKQLIKDRAAKNEPLLNDLKSLRGQIEQQLLSDSPDTAVLADLNQKVAGDMQEIGSNRIDFLLKVKGVIGADNFAKLSEIRKAKKAQWKEKIKAKMQEKTSVGSQENTIVGSQENTNQ